MRIVSVCDFAHPVAFDAGLYQLEVSRRVGTILGKEVCLACDPIAEDV